MKLCLFLATTLLFAMKANAANYYWIGGQGNWNDPTHWSLTSGGATASVVPGASDNVFIDNNSGMVAGDTLTINVNPTILNFTANATNGTILANGKTIACASFISNNAKCNFSVTNCVFKVSGQWLVTNAGLFNWVSSGTLIKMTNVGSTVFEGASKTYDTLISAASSLEIDNNNVFDFIKVAASSTLLLKSGSTQTTDSLVANGTCAAKTIIKKTGVGANAIIKKTGYKKYVGASISIDSVNATTTGGYTYSLSGSTVASSTGWQFKGAKFYWIGGTGNWSDGTKWSYTSGGGASGCVPNFGDSVYFDANSFSAPSQVVTADVAPHFSFLDWSGATFSSTWKLANTAQTMGDVKLNSNLTITRTNFTSVFEFISPSAFDPDNAVINVNISVNTSNGTDLISLKSDLMMTDSSSIFLSVGSIDFNNHVVKAGTILASQTTLLLKKLDFDASNITLTTGLDIDSTTNFTFIAGTSKLFIGDTNKTNYLYSSGQTFNDVTLWFNKNGSTQRLTGSNTFDSLTILKNSYITFDSTKTQTITSYLSIMGTCDDTVYLFSTGTQEAFLKKTSTVNVTAHCVNFDNVGASGAAQTAYFSSALGTHSGWALSSTPPVTASFTMSGGLCFGDTVNLTNNTTVFSGLPSDFVSDWYFNDGTGHWDPAPPQDTIYDTDTTWVGYVQDTSKHVFLVGGDISVILKSTNLINNCFSYDTVAIHINKPSIQITSSDYDNEICAGDVVSFRATSGVAAAAFQFYLNGDSLSSPSVNDTLYVTDTLVDQDTVGVLSYENGCPSDTMVAIITAVDSLPVFVYTSSDSDTSICLGDSVYFYNTSTDPLLIYQYLVDGNPVHVGANYGTNSLLDQDTVSVIAKNTKQCRDTSSMIFNVNPLPSTALASSVVGNVICTGQSVTFTASGAASYEFFKDGTSLGVPSATSTYTTTSLVTGDTISVVGYSINNCTFKAPQFFSYTVNPLPNVGFTTSSPTTICSNQTVSFNASGASQYNYYINGTLDLGPTSLTSYSPATINNQDTLYVIGSFSGCSDTSTAYIFTVNTAPTTTLVSSAPGNTACSQSNVTFTSSGATTYEFFVNGVSQGSPSSVTTFSSSSLNNGDIISVVGESNTCTVSQAITMSVLPLPNVNIFSNDADNIICQTGSITFTGTNSVQYELFIDGISQGAPQVSNTFTPVLPIDTSSVYIQGTGSNGCVANSSTMTAIVHPTPIVNLTSSDGDNTICNGDGVTFYGTGSNMYQFFINGTSQGSMSVVDSFTTSNLLNGQIVSIIGSSYGCTGNSNTLTFTVNAIPSVILSSTDIDNTFCQGSNVVYSANGAATYEFFIDGISQGAPSAIDTFDASVMLGGVHDIKVTGSTSACYASDSISFLVHSLPNAGISSSDTNNAICSGDNVVYTSTGGSSYQFFVNGAAQGAFSPLNTYSTSALADNDSVSVIVQSNYFCVDSAWIPGITVNTAPVLTFTTSDSDSTICIGDSVSFTASGANLYQFFINGIAQNSLSTDSTFSSLTLNNNDAITVLGDTLGCTTTSSAIIYTVHSYPVVSMTNNAGTQLCNGDTVDITAAGASLYQFYVNGSAVTGFSVNPNYNGSVNNNDVVTVSGSMNNCVANSSDSIHYTVLTHPTLSVISSDADNIICIGDTVTLTSSGASTYQFAWNQNVVQTGASNTFSTSQLDNGDSLIVTGYNGNCISTTTSIFPFVVNQMNLSMTVSPSTMICQGTPVTLTASGGDLYEFFVNGTSQGAMSASNSITLPVVMDQDELFFDAYSNTTLCTQKLANFVIMDVLVTPVISSNSSLEFCEGDSITLLSNSPSGNQWYLNGTPISGATDSFYVVHQQGMYALDVTHGGYGNVWSFGANSSGIFANGTNLDNVNPIEANLTDSVTLISSGADFTLSLTQSGKVYAWGKNDFGQLGNGTYTNSNLPIQVAPLSNIKTIAAAEKSAMAVSNSGTVYVWGENISGQLGTGTNSVINFPYLNPAFTNVDTVVAGKNHFIVLKNDGTVWENGYNASGQLGQGNLLASFVPVQVMGLANIVSIGAGESSSFAIDNQGRLYVWGGNGSGQLGLADLNNRLTPTLSTLKNVLSAQGGSNYSAFLTQQYKLYTTGDNSYGQLGTGDFVNRTIPTAISFGGIKQVSTGEYTALICRNDGSVYGFGDNSLGQLSTISGSTVSSPSYISTVEGVTFVSAARQASHLIYGIQNTCSATSVNAVMDSLPNVVITVTNSNELSTLSSGIAYQWYLNGLPIPGANQPTFVATANGSYTVSVTFSSGCSAISPQVLIGVTGVKEFDFANSISAYPNPTSELFNLAFGKELLGKLISMRIQDNSGRLIAEKHLISQDVLPIDVRGFEPGVYYLSVQCDMGVTTFRFVKMD